MELYLLRHGIAADAGADGKDASRPLTAEGKEKLRLVLDRARLAGVVPDVVLTSPLRRAVETAQIAAEVLGYAGTIHQTRVLEPLRAPDDVWNEIGAYRSHQRILLAGHQPLMGELMAWLLDAPHPCVDFKKGALARVDAPPVAGRPRGVLQWLITPRLSLRE